MQAVQWKIKSFSALSGAELYEILKIRQQVFVVEQACHYLDADGNDDRALHLWAEENGDVLAYCRIFDKGIQYREASIGRILTNPNHRNRCLGKTFVKIAFHTIASRYRTVTVRISAQDYLIKFYTDLGFQDTGIKYLEDHIPHTEMVKR